MNTNPYPWQLDSWNTLNNQIELTRMPHALMLTGPSGIGKRDFALALARRLLCHSPREGAACGECRQCLLFAAGSHPDFMLLEPEQEGKVIKIDDIRALSEFAIKTASQGGWRVMVLCPAEAMNVNASNAFLKTLEEPGRQVLLILVSHQPGAVLPTIRSRCRILPMAQPGEELTRQWLSDNTSHGADIPMALSQAGGRPLLALRLLETGLLDQLRRFETGLRDLEEGALSALEVAKIFQELPPRDLIDWFMNHVYGLLRSPQSLDSAWSRRLFRFNDRLIQVKQRLLSTTNPNLQLLWEEVLMDWKSVVDWPHQKTGLAHRG
ncbi:MAG: hypothetical protein VR73_14010 [Gammaproteobacteria bacterium BRH_c0]|nr:MAG: hypothetical protein VR73_14010 [Gammaproteobacteria bacterium BRH_c0]